MKSSPAPRFLEVGDVNHAFLYLCVHCLHVISQTPSQSSALKPPVYNTKTGNSSWTCWARGMFQKTHWYWGKQSGGMNIPTKAGSHLKMSTNTIHQFPIKVAGCSWWKNSRSFTIRLWKYSFSPERKQIIFQPSIFRCYCSWKKSCTSWYVYTVSQLLPRWFSRRISEPSATYVKFWRGNIIWT